MLPYVRPSIILGRPMKRAPPSIRLMPQISKVRHSPLPVGVYQAIERLAVAMEWCRHRVGHPDVHIETIVWDPVFHPGVIRFREMLQQRRLQLWKRARWYSYQQ